MTPIRDHMVYIVVCGHRSGPYVRERYVADLDRKTTVHEVATGQFDDIKQILELNPVEGTCRDVTEDILTEAGRLYENEPSISPSDRLKFQHDHERDLRKHMGAV